MGPNGLPNFGGMSIPAAYQFQQNLGLASGPQPPAIFPAQVPGQLANLPPGSAGVLTYMPAPGSTPLMPGQGQIAHTINYFVNPAGQLTFVDFQQQPPLYSNQLGALSPSHPNYSTYGVSIWPSTQSVSNNQFFNQVSNGTWGHYVPTLHPQ
jgi:hypothetical protein